jgi:hypothetical protein
MTCREFKQTALSLSLWELARSDDSQISDHAVECPSCGVWLDEQQMLAAGMQALQARTAGCQAGPHVERALLRLFRQETVEAGKAVAARRSAPFAFGLSRFFEVGAYAAAAAAIVVGLFLGARLLQRHSTDNVQSHSIPAATSPARQAQTVGSVAQPEVRPGPVVSAKRAVAAHPVAQGNRRGSAAAASQAIDDPDYVALMFCDPLICSSETQVVRMELPVTEGNDHDAQTQVADVVVGDDGLVRAMRIVNER